MVIKALYLGNFAYLCSVKLANNTILGGKEHGNKKKTKEENQPDL